MNNDKLLSMIKEKYPLKEVTLNNDLYSLFFFGKEKDKNYIIVKNDICSDDELSQVQKFIDSLEDRKMQNASFVFIAFVKNGFNKDDYFAFNGNSFLHSISYNLETASCIYDKKFYYFGGKKIKQLLTDIEQYFLRSKEMLSKNECILLIEECFRKKNISPPVNIGSPLMNLSEVDLCIDCVSDVLCNEGFDKNSKPNPYGLKLETVIDYLSRIRFCIVDNIEFVWDEK